MLKVCKVDGDKLVIPSDVRSTFLTCPVHGPEWRELLAAFDKQWATPLQSAGGQQTSPVKKEVKTEGADGETKTESYDWKSKFPNEPSTYEELKKKHGAEQLTELPASIAGLLLVITPGPALFIVGKDACHLDVHQPLVTHGPGVWLLGDKATKFMNNNAGKGFLCEWRDDQVPVCVEDTSFSYLYVVPSHNEKKALSTEDETYIMKSQLCQLKVKPIS